MATQVTLKADLRSTRGKGAARKLRAEGRLPAVVYGAEADPVALSLSAHETSLLFHAISVDNTIVNLEIEGKKGQVPTLIREIHAHPVRPEILHVDFLRIQAGVAVELEVPIHLSGTPKGVRDDGGVLEQSLHHVPISCIPTAIPDEILVDVTGLEVGDSVHLLDLTFPEGVEVLIDGDRIVCSVQTPTVLKSTDEAEEEVDEDGEPERIGEDAEDDSEDEDEDER